MKKVEIGGVFKRYRQLRLSRSMAGWFDHKTLVGPLSSLLMFSKEFRKKVGLRILGPTFVKDSLGGIADFAVKL